MLDITLTDHDRELLATAEAFLRDRSRYYQTTTLKANMARRFDECANAVGRVRLAKEVAND